MITETFSPAASAPFAQAAMNIVAKLSDTKNLCMIIVLQDWANLIERVRRIQAKNCGCRPPVLIVSGPPKLSAPPVARRRWTV
ncbi:MAG: hypothetical protein ACYCZU_12575, partial [Devosia sp.]